MKLHKGELTIEHNSSLTSILEVSRGFKDASKAVSVHSITYPFSHPSILWTANLPYTSGDLDLWVQSYFIERNCEGNRKLGGILPPGSVCPSILVLYRQNKTGPRKHFTEVGLDWKSVCQMDRQLNWIEQEGGGRLTHSIDWLL